MTPGQVREQWGLPNDTGTTADGDTYWLYDNDGSEFEVRFKYGRVDELSDAAGEPLGGLSFNSPIAALLSPAQEPPTNAEARELYGLARAALLEDRELDALVALRRCLSVKPGDRNCGRFLVEDAENQYLARLTARLNGSIRISQRYLGAFRSFSWVT